MKPVEFTKLPGLPLLNCANKLALVDVLIEYETFLAKPPLSNLPKITPLVAADVILNHASIVQLPLPGSRVVLSTTAIWELDPLNEKYGDV